MTIQNYTRTKQDYTGIYRTIKHYTGLYQLYKTIQNSTGKQDYTGLVKTILDYDYTENFRTITIKDDLGLYRTVENSI